MAHSPKGAPAPTAAALAAQPDLRALWRDRLDCIDNWVRTLEGTVDLVTPYTTEEERRATVLRTSVAWALEPVARGLREAIDAGWSEFQGEQA